MRDMKLKRPHSVIHSFIRLPASDRSKLLLPANNDYMVPVRHYCQSHILSARIWQFGNES